MKHTIYEYFLLKDGLPIKSGWSICLKDAIKELHQIAQGQYNATGFVYCTKTKVFCGYKFDKRYLQI